MQLVHSCSPATQLTGKIISLQSHREEIQKDLCVLGVFAASH